MKLVTPAQMRRIDDVAIRERHIPGATLMERAGKAAAREAMQRFEPESVAVVTGKGNNAGDGFIAARELALHGVRTTLYLLRDPAELEGDALAAWRTLPAPAELPRVERPSAAALRQQLIHHDLVIDAIFGTGLRGALTSPWAELIEAINACRMPVLSIDIPSGLSGDRAEPETSDTSDKSDQSGLGAAPPHVRASVTVTIGLPKLGLVLDPGVRSAGTIVVADIGFPRDLLEDESISTNLMTMDDARALLPPRPPGGHKGTFGRVMILGGSVGMTGAAVLAARAAARSGAGMVFACYPESLGVVMESHLLEAVKVPLKGDSPWFGGPMAAAALEAAAGMQAVAIGPGLGKRPATRAFLRQIVRGVAAPLVIDADGLNLLEGRTGDLARRAGPTVLTPHPGEAGRLLGLTVREVESRRLDAFLHLAHETGAVVALKGAQTVVTAPSGQRYLNPSGNSGLAKGGSGDVLTGLIAGLLAQGLDALAATRLGVFLHGVAADVAAERHGQRAMLPGDVIKALGEAFRRIEGAH